MKNGSNLLEISTKHPEINPDLGTHQEDNFHQNLLKFELTPWLILANALLHQKLKFNLFPIQVFFYQTKNLNLLTTSFASVFLFFVTLSLITFSEASPLNFRFQQSKPDQIVTQLQNHLKVLGYLSGELTGTYNSKTEFAVKTFQQDHHLTVTGIADPQTLDQINFYSDLVQLEKQQSNHKVEKLDSKNIDSQSKFQLKAKITGEIAPKSIVHSGSGLFFAQNMMYEHSITVYDRQFNLIKTLKDGINLASFGYPQYHDSRYKGAPVEVAFSPDSQSAYVSNYQMFGSEFNNPGYDTCEPSDQFDDSFIYRINTQTLNIENVIKVGSVPKYVAVSPNNRWVLVSNWCSGDLSIIDNQLNKEIKRIPLGQFPRGIAIDPSSEIAYIGIMGTSDIAVVNLKDYSVDWMRNVGLYPRHLVLDSTGQYLYVTLNGDDHVAKIDTETGEILGKIFTGSAPRSMVLSETGEFLYVVNYYSHTVSKVRTADLEIVDTITVDLNPIGITYDPQTKQVWVACYTGSLVILQDHPNSP